MNDEQKYIKIVGATTNNLKYVSVKIPKNKITIFTGVSGSGKSSLVFETIAQEAGRQLNETYSKFVQNFLPNYTRPDVEAIENLALSIIIDQKRIGGNSRSTLGTIIDIQPLLRVLFSRVASPCAGPAFYYSFNEQHGMCKTCQGIGKIITLDLDNALDQNKSLNEGAILLSGYGVGTYLWKTYATSGFFELDKKIKDYTELEFEQLVYCKSEKMKSSIIEGTNFTYEGLVERFLRQNIRGGEEKTDTGKKRMTKFAVEKTCDCCNGKRYNESILESKIGTYSIADVCDLQIDELLNWTYTITDPKIEPVIQNIQARLKDLIDIGLDYMFLNRETTTLSGGESQRVKMVKHLLSNLTDVIYIFDEPSIGLHPRDVHRLNELLIKLRDKGNTVLVVEHDPDVIKIADYIIDMGPKAGSSGGKIVFEGTYEQLLESDTLTGQFLLRKMPIKQNVRVSNEFYETSKSSLHNLKGVSLRIPKGIFTVISGVAGSGKSTLVNQVFAKEFDQAIVIDQSPVGANLRSNPATYTGIMDGIRKLFATHNGVDSSIFSYNSQGACEECNGRGTIENDLVFMTSVETICEVCQGKRYKQEVYQYTYQGKTIVDILDMTIQEASEFFLEGEINRKIMYLNQVGLHYMRLGQSLDTLSGGECQRLKLAKELQKKGNIYILDEPTTGLHMADIELILKLIQKLVDRGNTVIVIEHHLDIIRNADWIIDVGLEGGHKGGTIIFEGKPEDLINCRQSITANYL